MPKNVLALITLLDQIPLFTVLHTGLKSWSASGPYYGAIKRVCTCNWSCLYYCKIEEATVPQWSD